MKPIEESASCSLKRRSKNKLIGGILMSLLIAITAAALWRTPITAYQPHNEVEKALSELFIQYITARNNRDVRGFLATLHDDCRYMIAKDQVVTKAELRGLLPELWMQNDDNSAAFEKCMTWECINENYYPKGMLINPRFRIEGDHAEVHFKFVAGFFTDYNYFYLSKTDQTWRIIRFLRPLN